MKKMNLSVCLNTTACVIAVFLIAGQGCEEDKTGPRAENTPVPVTATPVPTTTPLPIPTATPSYNGAWEGWTETWDGYGLKCSVGEITFKVIDNYIVDGHATVCVFGQSDQQHAYIDSKQFVFEGPIINGEFNYYRRGSWCNPPNPEFNGHFYPGEECLGTWKINCSAWDGEYHATGSGLWKAGNVSN
jgi:hypothetical protein